MVSEREHGVWRRYRLSPVPPARVIVGTLLARYLMILAAGILQVGAAQIGVLKVGGVEHSPTQIGVAEVKALERGLQKLLLLQVAAMHVGLKILQAALGAQFRRRDRLGRRRRHQGEQHHRQEHPHQHLAGAGQAVPQPTQQGGANHGTTSLGRSSYCRRQPQRDR